MTASFYLAKNFQGKKPIGLSSGLPTAMKVLTVKVKQKLMPCLKVFLDHIEVGTTKGLQ